MKPRDDLFRLIKSLSQGEKRQFKLSALPGVQNKNYLLLFDAIDKQTEYDEKKIKAKFAGKAFIRHLSSEKNYLQSGILKMLRSNAGDNKLQSFFLAAAEVEALKSKGLFDLALEKVKRLAQETEAYEYFGLAQEMLAQERFIFMRTNRTYAIERYQSWEADNDRLMEKQENIIDFVKVNQRIAMITYIKGAVLNETQANEYEQLVTTGVMGNESQVKTPSAAVFYHTHLVAYYGTARNELAKAMEHSHRLLQHMSDHPFLVIKSPQNYITCVHNHVVYALAQGQWEEASLWLERLERFPEPFDIALTQQLVQFKLQRTILLRLDVIIHKGDKATLVSDTAQIRQTLAQNQEILDDFQVISLHFGLGSLFFVHEAYKEAAKEFSWLIEFGKKELGTNYKNLAKILLVLIQAEKGDSDMVTYVAKKFKLHKLEGVEKLLVDFICNELPELNSAKATFEAFSRLKKTFLAHPGHDGIGRYFEFIAWMDSRLEGKPMGELMKAKWKK